MKHVRRTVSGLALVGLLAMPGAVMAQSEGEGTDVATLEMTDVEPGVQRVVRDAAGHDLTERYPNNHRDMDHVAVGPDGTVWIASTASGEDNEFLDHFQVWPLGTPGLYGQGEGVPQHIDKLMFAPEGALWAIGSGIASFDGASWSSGGTGSNYKATTPDGRRWLATRHGPGVESWDGTEFTSHLPGRWVEQLLVGPEGSLWVAGDGVAQFDGQVWTEHLRNQYVGSLLLGPGGDVWIAGERGVSRFDGAAWVRELRGEYQSLAMGPDGRMWAGGGDGVATYDGESWSQVQHSARRIEAPDGSTWRISSGGVQRTIDGEQTRYIQGKQINEIALAPDGSVWAVGNIGPRENGGVYRIQPEE